MSDAISAHGTTVARNSTIIGELRDITPPALTRNTFDTTTQNDDDDSYVVGIRRKGEIQFTINFLQASDGTHDGATGLLKAYQDGSKDLYTITFPDASVWNVSGYVSNISVKAPVDGELAADVTIRPTNAIVFTP